MPLKLVQAPHSAKGPPSLYVRGVHLGVTVFRSARTADRALAKKVLRQIERDIESGAFGERKGPTFAQAVVTYIQAGGNKRFLKPLLDHFHDRQLTEIDQAAIDDAAKKLYPTATPATRNRQVYTPMSAVLSRAGYEWRLRRPAGSCGEKRVRWLRDEDEAGRLIEEARRVDPELATLLAFLIYTGLRVGEALALTTDDIHIEHRTAFVGMTKNGEPRSVHLTPYLVATLTSHPRGLARPGRVFRYTKGQRLYQKLAKASTAAGLPWFTFHVARHTYATWMRRHAAMDDRGLVGTGAWKDTKSVSRYSHVVTTEEARKADLLPTPKPKAIKQEDVG